MATDIFARASFSDHRPDEEGIKTLLSEIPAYTRMFQTTDLMKKGLRLIEPAKSLDMPLSDHRPDEEGIKTPLWGRLPARRQVSDHRPDEEGIKTATLDPPPPPQAFQTTDLMKKGLRLIRSPMVSPLMLSDHRPDEEGIKTPRALKPKKVTSFQTTDLMKKGLRPLLPPSRHPGFFQTTDLMKKGLRRPKVFHILPSLTFRPQT